MNEMIYCKCRDLENEKRSEVCETGENTTPQWSQSSLVKIPEKCAIIKDNWKQTIQ